MKSIEERYKIIKRIYSKYETNYENLIENSDKIKSLSCLYSKILEVQLINQSILSPELNYYNSQILLRVILEHYLVGYYVYLKIQNEGNDIVGEDFYDSYFKSEIIKRENYNLGLDKIKNPSHEKDISDYLDTYEIFGNITPFEVNAIHFKAKQFDIRKISNYLANNLGKEEYLKQLHSLTFDFLSKYNNLSSFIHGGILAEVKTFGDFEETKAERAKILTENIEWGKIIETSLKFYFLTLLFKKDEEKLIELTDFF